MRRWYFLTLALVGVALGLFSPAPAYASTYIGDQTDKREAAANYLGYGWQEQSEELKNELGTNDDSWCYDRWQAWLNSLSWSNGYWVTSYEGFMLVDARDKAKADFEKAIKYVETGGFEGSGGGDIPDSGSTGGGSSTAAVSTLTINTYFVYNRKTPTVGKVCIPSDYISKIIKVKADLNKCKYFVFAMSSENINESYLDGYNRVAFHLLGFNTAPTFTYNASSKCYVCDLSSCVNCGWVDSRSDKNLTGNFLSCTILPNKTYYSNNQTPNIKALHFVSDIMQVELSKPDLPTVVPTGGDTINVYEGDTSNITTNIDNSSSSVENSTTIYDTENNTYTTVNNITTNNNVDVSAITQRLDSINAKVGQIGTDLNSLFGELNQNLSVLFLGIGTTISDGVSTLRNQLVQAVSWLQIIESDLRGLDKSVKSIPDNTSGGGGSGGSANADVDLSTIESDLDDIKGKLDALLVISGVDAAANVLQTLFDLLSGIMDAVGEKLGAIGSALSGLTEVFPFSIPWDVAAMAALFAADPVTPVFDVPLPAPNGGTQNFHVDLSALDPVASVFRSGEMVLFALGLALRTRDMMGGGDDIA